MSFPLDLYRDDIHGRGRPVALRRVAATNRTAGQPEHGANGLGTATATFKAKFKDFSARDIDGDNIRETDVICHIYPPDLGNIPPARGDQIIDGGKVRTVHAVAEKRPGSVALRYDVHLRG